MDRIVPISEARYTLDELVKEAEEHEVYLIKHGRPAGVLLSTDAYERLLDRIEDLEDTLSVVQAHDPIPYEPSVKDIIEEEVAAARANKEADFPSDAKGKYRNR